MHENDTRTAGVADNQSNGTRYEREPVTASVTFLYGILSVIALISPIYVAYVYHGFANSKNSFDVAKLSWEQAKKNREETYRKQIDESTSIQVKIDQSKSEFTEVNKSLSATKAQREALKNEIAILDPSLQSLRVEKAQSETKIQDNKEILIGQQNQLNEMQATLAGMESEVARNELIKSSLIVEVNKLEGDRSTYEKSQEEADSRLRSARNQLDLLTDELALVNAQLLEKQEKLRASNQKIEQAQQVSVSIKSLQSDLALLQGKIDPLEKRLPELNQQIEQKVAEREDLDSEIRQIRKNRTTARSELDKTLVAESEAKARLSALLETDRLTDEQIATVKTELNSVKTEIVDLEESKRSLELQNGRLSVKQKELMQENQILQEEIKGLQDSFANLQTVIAEAQNSSGVIATGIALALEQQGVLEADLLEFQDRMKTKKEELSMLQEAEQRLIAKNNELLLKNAALEDRSTTLEQKLTEDLNIALTEFLNSFNGLLKRIQENADNTRTGGGE
ncbi:MAG: hypothetical protein ACJ0DK_01105 [Planctomycetota bacterium]